MRFVVTGGSGFVGSHLVEYLLNSGHDVVSLDCLTYAGPLRNLKHLNSGRLRLWHHDFSQPLPISPERVDYVIHNGAASHVLRSVVDPGLFVQSNVVGTLNLLEWARHVQPRKFVYVSTDEVFGAAGERPYHPHDPLKPTNPYAATKAGGEFLARSYFRSFGVPVVITRTVNLFGERQHPEKFVPLVVRKLLRNETLDVHTQDGRVGSRSWLYAGEQARALAYLALHGMPGCAYHVASGVKKNNLTMANTIAKILGLRLQREFKEVVGDFDYSIQESPQAVAWKSPESFEQQLRKTVLWYRDNQEFLL